MKAREYTQRLLIALIALGCAATQAGAPNSGYGDVLKRDWYVYESKFFRVISDQSEEVVGRQIHDLELFRTYVLSTLDQQTNQLRLTAQSNPDERRLLDALPVAEHERVDVYLFSRRAHLVRLFNSRDVYAFMRPGLRKSVMVIAPNHKSAKPNAAAFHEYVHFLLRALGGSYFPPWYEEGLAEFFAATTIGDDALVIGDLPLPRLENLKSRHKFPLQDVFRAGTPKLLASAVNQAETNGAGGFWGSSARQAKREERRRRRLPNSPVFYAQSWSMIHMLLLGHHAGLERRDHLLADYVLDIQRGLEPQDALSQHFDGKYRRLERDLRRYVGRQSRIPRLSIPLGQFDYDPRYQRAALSGEEVAYRLGVLAAPISPLRARKIFRWALETFPNSSRSLIGMGVAQRSSGRYVKAVNYVSASLKASPENAYANFEFADTVSIACQHLRRTGDTSAEIDCATLLPQAQLSYAEALRLSPDNPEFQANYGVALLQAGQVKRASALLTDAFAATPWSPGLSFALGESLRRQGEFERAKPLLNRAAVWFVKNPSLRIRAQYALALAEQGVAKVPTGTVGEVQLKTLN